MNLPIVYNRAGELDHGGWMHIVPKGVLPNAEAGIEQVLDEASMDSIMADFKETERRYGNRWPGLYFGEEHHIYDASKSSAALAWAKQFEKRSDGIWAKPELTDLGTPAIKNKRFKWTSFVADPKDLEPMGGNKYRVLAVETVGFTNLPNGKHLLSPITNRQFRRGLEPAAGSEDNNKTKNKMKNLLMDMGLSAEAGEDSARDAWSKMKNRAEKSEADLTPAKNRVIELEKSNGELLTEQVDGILALHGVKEEKVINRLRPLLAPLKNREDRVNCLVELGFKEGGETQTQTRATGTVLNRGQAKTPAGRGAASEGDDQAKVEKIRNRATALKAGGMTFDAAWAQASSEVASA